MLKARKILGSGNRNTVLLLTEILLCVNRYLARKSRIHFPGAFYHVIARGNQKQAIFLDKEDFRTYIAYLSEYKSKYNFHLYAYALMKNHLHLLVEVEGTPLCKIMQVMQFRYTRYFNKRYGKVGHLFQGRYKAILCERENYLMELVRYIHLNPVRAKVVDDPEMYPWIGHLAYLGKLKNDLIDEDLVLSQFSTNRTLAREEYNQFILRCLNSGHQDKYYKVKGQRYLGEDEFIEQIECKQENFESKSIIYDIPMDEIVLEISNTAGITKDKLYSLTRARRGAYGRSLVAYLARKLSGCLVKDIAEHFRREPVTISQAIIKLENLIQKDKKTEKMVKHMERNLIKNKKKKYLITTA